MVAGIPPLRSGRCAAASVGMTACEKAAGFVVRVVEWLPGSLRCAAAGAPLLQSGWQRAIPIKRSTRNDLLVMRIHWVDRLRRRSLQRKECSD